MQQRRQPRHSIQSTPVTRGDPAQRVQFYSPVIHERSASRKPMEGAGEVGEAGKKSTVIEHGTKYRPPESEHGGGAAGEGEEQGATAAGAGNAARSADARGCPGRGGTGRDGGDGWYGRGTGKPRRVFSPRRGVSRKFAETRRRVRWRVVGTRQGTCGGVRGPGAGDDAKSVANSVRGLESAGGRVTWRMAATV
ncbi:hypothetical protein FB451DRAFT_1370961 [Mycena latifolia]|nr:hypothetical protein FB451DRAFT_1370961 [Mycena latifolia]